MRSQGGVFKCDDARADVLYVEIDKDPKHYTPTTLYDDRPISPGLFQWESQSRTRADSTTGRRYRRATAPRTGAPCCSSASKPPTRAASPSRTASSGPSTTCHTSPRSRCGSCGRSSARCRPSCSRRSRAPAEPQRSRSQTPVEQRLFARLRAMRAGLPKKFHPLKVDDSTGLPERGVRPCHGREGHDAARCALTAAPRAQAGNHSACAMSPRCYRSE